MVPSSYLVNCLGQSAAALCGEGPSGRIKASYCGYTYNTLIRYFSTTEKRQLTHRFKEP